MRLYFSLPLVALIQLAWAPQALATDWEASDTRTLGAPGFLPYAGEVEGEFTYTYSADLYDFRNGGPSAPTQAYDRSANSFLPALTYGITEDIAVSADLGWGNARNSQTYTYTGFKFVPPFRFIPIKVKQTFHYHSLGADDPSFSLTWRAIDQRTAPVNVDITASYSPDIFKARSAQLNETGTVATGGQAGSIELAVMREMRFLTLRAYGTFAYEGRRNEQTSYGSEDLRSGAHAVYSAGFQSEVRLLPWLAVNGGVQAQRAVRYDRADLFNGGDFTLSIRPGGSISPYAGVVVPVLPQRLVAEFLYQHDFVHDETQAYEGGENRYSKQESNNFIARALFTFGGPSPGRPAAVPPPVPAASPAPAMARTYLVFFDWDRADLSARARQIIAEAAMASTHVQTTRIEVNGYTDLSGTAPYNQKLSLRRAASVEAELVRDGVGHDEISLHGYGESNPLVPTAPGVREPENRRVEIILH